MKIPFDIKHRPEVESGKYSVQSEEHLPIRIASWDVKPSKDSPRTILALVEMPTGEEQPRLYYIDGKYNRGIRSDKDLYLVDSRKEPTSFENAMLRYLQDAANRKDDESIIEATKEHSPELLDIALKEFTGKAVEWLRKNAGMYWYDDMNVPCPDDFIEDFLKEFDNK